MTDAPDPKEDDSEPNPGPHLDNPDLSDDANEDDPDRYDDDEDDDDDDPDDPFGGGGFLGRGPGGLSSTLRALSGMMSGVSSRLRGLLEQLRSDDQTIQLLALQELSEILLVSTEDNLAGHFSPDSFVKELVKLMQPPEFGEINPDIQLLACRCIANLMEALPTAIPNVVYGGSIPVLCSALLNPGDLDVAEQALIVSNSSYNVCFTITDNFRLWKKYL